MNRTRRPHEVFECRCHNCNRLVEFPVSSVRDHVGACSLCGARLEILWREPVQ